MKDYFWGNYLYLNNLDLFFDEGMTVGIFLTREQAVVQSGHARGERERCVTRRNKGSEGDYRNKRKCGTNTVYFC